MEKTDTSQPPSLLDSRKANIGDEGSAKVEITSRQRSVLFPLIGIVCWNFLVAIDATALSVALPTIAHELKASDVEAYWTGTAFVLCSAAFQPVCAALSNALGRKPVVLSVLLSFTAGTIVCSVAHHVSVLLFGRCLQGFGAGGLLTMSYVVMADMFTLQERTKYQSLIALTWLVGVVVAPIMGGGFAAHATWRWIFWFNLPFCGLSLLVVIFLMEFDYKPPHAPLKALASFDWMGSVLFVGSLTSFLLAISWGGVMFAWSSFRTIVPLVFGVMGLAVWAVYSASFAATPIMPFVIFRERSALINYVGTIVQGLAQFGLLYYLPIYYQLVKGYSPMISGVALLPQCLASPILSTITTILIMRTNVLKPHIMIGWAIFALGLGVLQVLDCSTSVAAWIFINIPSGVGLGILFVAPTLATQASVENRADISPEKVLVLKGIAAALNPFFRAVGQSLGIVLAQATFNNQMKERGGRMSVENVSDAHNQQTQAYVASLKVVWWVLFALVAAAGLASAGMRNIKVRNAEVVRANSKSEDEV